MTTTAAARHEDAGTVAVIFSFPPSSEPKLTKIASLSYLFTRLVPPHPTACSFATPWDGLVQPLSNHRFLPLATDPPAPPSIHRFFVSVVWRVPSPLMKGTGGQPRVQVALPPR